MGLKKSGRKVKSAQTALEMVEHLQEHDGATLTELCEHFDCARSTAHSYLSTLESMEYVTKDADTYRVGLKFLSHGIAAKNSVSISNLSKEPLETLAANTGSVSWLIVEEHGRGVFLDNAMSPQAVRTYGRVSKRVNLHTIAGGKAILAHMDEADRRAIIRNYGLPAETEHTIGDPEALDDELDDIRNHRYAVSHHEAALGVSSAAAPILHDEQILGAVHISSLTSRLENGTFDQNSLEAVMEAAEAAEKRYNDLSE